MEEQVAMVLDPEDEHLLGEYGWYVVKGRNTNYVRSHIPGSGRTHRKVYLHRLVMDAPSGVQVDHINGNGLDNRKANLRLCSQTENLRNSRNRKHHVSSRYRGVRKTGKRFYAIIRADGRRYYLGSYNTELEASLAYDKAAVKLHGEFAKCNHVVFS